MFVAFIRHGRQPPRCCINSYHRIVRIVHDFHAIANAKLYPHFINQTNIQIHTHFAHTDPDVCAIYFIFACCKSITQHRIWPNRWNSERPPLIRPNNWRVLCEIIALNWKLSASKWKLTVSELGGAASVVKRKIETGFTYYIHVTSVIGSLLSCQIYRLISMLLKSVAKWKKELSCSKVYNFHIHPLIYTLFYILSY